MFLVITILSQLIIPNLWFIINYILLWLDTIKVGSP